MVIHLGCASPHISSNLPRDRAGHTLQPKLPAPLFGLAPGGVYPATGVTTGAVRSYRTISPLPFPKKLGGIFSVALSVGSRLPGVTWRLAQWSPDFPPFLTEQRPSGRLSLGKILPLVRLRKPNFSTACSASQPTYNEATTPSCRSLLTSI